MIFRHVILSVFSRATNNRKDEYYEKCKKTYYQLEDLGKNKNIILNISVILSFFLYYVPYIFYYFSILVIIKDKSFDYICLVQIAITFIMFLYVIIESKELKNTDNVNSFMALKREGYNILYMTQLIAEINEIIFLFLLITQIILPRI